MNTSENQQVSRTLKDYAGIAIRGFAMGAADVVPGVSGGTLAFILGIYEELINSIRAFTMLETIKMLASFQIKKAITVLPWRFLLALGIGILSAIFSLAKFLGWALEHHPSLLWSFFFGLVVASIITVIHRVKQWNGITAIALVAGGILAYLIVGLVPAETPESWWFLFLSGAIAICAMILPGISGSFILVLLGKYQYILAAVNNRDVVTLFWVTAGTIVGIATFAQVLGWFFKHHHDITVSVLIGFMAGSLRKMWPWKKTLEAIISRHGKEVPIVQMNILPTFSSEVGSAILLALVGFGIVFVINRLATSKDSRYEE